MNRAHNFNAGPAVLPFSVIEEAKEGIYNFNNSGMSILEISHRTKDFDKVIIEAEEDMLKLMGLSPADYTVIFVGGGASTQFAMVPMNFMKTKAEYVVTGVWAKKALKEAKILGNAVSIASSEADNFTYIPKEFKVSPDADYVHITTNNTIYGTEWGYTPEVGNVPLIADMSSDMLSRELDYTKYKLIYAGAQKNIGPAGVVAVVVDKAWAEANAKTGLPTMFLYDTHIKNKSLYNTPPVYAIYVLGLTMKWALQQGGLGAIHENNKKKAGVIYDVIDAYPDFYKGAVTVKEDRSLMNITFVLQNKDLEGKFIEEAKALNMVGLKGHRSVGGMRASTYNACPLESCQALAQFMESFRKANM